MAKSKKDTTPRKAAPKRDVNAGSATTSKTLDMKTMQDVAKGALGTILTQDGTGRGSFTTQVRKPSQTTVSVKTKGGA